LSQSALADVRITANKVLKILKKLKSNGSAGPDGLAPIFFKNTAASLAEPLSVLFTKIVHSGSAPASWKDAVVVPIPKSGYSSNCEDYRPISLTNVICKICESIIKIDITRYVENLSLFENFQHGFLKGKSTCSNLLQSLSDWSVNINDHKCTRVVSIDFAKACNSVSIPKLIYKLNCLGVTGNLLKFIDSFLTNRTQRVRVEGAMSSSVVLNSGVPQGSVLCPLLFIIYTSDLTYDLQQYNVSLKSFADDTKLYSSISNCNDVDNIQFAIDSIYM